MYRTKYKICQILDFTFYCIKLKQTALYVVSIYNPIQDLMSLQMFLGYCSFSDLTQNSGKDNSHILINFFWDHILRCSNITMVLLLCSQKYEPATSISFRVKFSFLILIWTVESSKTLSFPGELLQPQIEAYTVCFYRISTFLCGVCSITNQDHAFAWK